jgi:hypothetical protein
MPEEEAGFIFNAKVAGRTRIAVELQEPTYAEDLNEAGIVLDDLRTIEQQGKLAEEYDRKQRADLAAKTEEQQAKLRRRQQVEKDDEQLRNRLPAVIHALVSNPTTFELGRWLAGVSFDRYRIKVTITAPSASEAGTPGAPSVEVPPPEEHRARVTRTDLHARFQSTAQFVESLLEAGREPIVEALAARRMDKERLTTLARDARALADALGGRALLTASEWTPLEADAAKAQKVAWESCRRMIRHVVRNKPDELKTFWAAC